MQNSVQQEDKCIGFWEDECTVHIVFGSGFYGDNNPRHVFPNHLLIVALRKDAGHFFYWFVVFWGDC